jgi:glutaredoxin
MFMIISKPDCWYCKEAAATLERTGKEFIEYKIGVNITREEALEMVPGARSVPQIFDGKHHIGGYNELIKYLGESDVN